MSRMRTLINVAEHLYQRHQGSCPKSRGGSRCRCGDGFPRFVVKIGEGSGKHGTQRNQQRTFDTQRQAELWLADRTRQKRQGTLSALDRTIGSYLDEYETDLEGGKAKSRGGTPLKPGTVKVYLQSILVLRKETADLLARPVDLVSPLDVQMAIDRLAGSRAERTVEKIITPLRTVFNRLERLGLIDSSPMGKILVPKDPPRSDRLDDVDPRATYLVIQTLSPRERAFLSICALAGMRPSEVQALRWLDVDMEAGLINVSRGYSGDTLTTPKTVASIRRVVLLDALRSEIDDWKNWVGSHREVAWLDDDALMFAREGDPNTPVTVVTIKQQARRQVSLQDWETIKPRSGRHIWVSANSAGGVDLVESMRSTGHTSPKVHLDTYGRQVAGKSDIVRAAVGAQFGARVPSRDEAEAEAWIVWQQQLTEENAYLESNAEAQGGGFTPRDAPLFDM